MEQIGILHHPKVPDSQDLAAEICYWLAERDVVSWTGSTWDEALVGQNIMSTSLLVVLGGDGSLLRAAHMAVAHGVPIFGINMGRVGFLSEAQPDDWIERLTQVINGNFWVEERLMLLAELERNGRIIGQFNALNDIVVGRGQQARVVRFKLQVDKDAVITYTADALIVATPTGSTAYAMAAGGPLLPPQLKNFVVLPVAAHLSFDRPLVLHETAEIAIHVEMDHDAYMTPDGQHGISLESGDRVLIKKYHRRCHFARVDSAGYFYRRLMGRLGYTR
jgi:NAD+ kinase